MKVRLGHLVALALVAKLLTSEPSNARSGTVRLEANERYVVVLLVRRDGEPPPSLTERTKLEAVLRTLPTGRLEWLSGEPYGFGPSSELVRFEITPRNAIELTYGKPMSTVGTLAPYPVAEVASFPLITPHP